MTALHENSHTRVCYRLQYTLGYTPEHARLGSMAVCKLATSVDALKCRVLGAPACAWLCVCLLALLLQPCLLQYCQDSICLFTHNVRLICGQAAEAGWQQKQQAQLQEIVGRQQPVGDSATAHLLWCCRHGAMHPSSWQHLVAHICVQSALICEETRQLPARPTHLCSTAAGLPFAAALHPS